MTVSASGVSSISSGPVVLGQQHTQVVAPADTNENTLYTLNIAGGVMGPNDTIRVTVLFSQTNSANSKTYKISLGGVGTNNILNTAATTSASLWTTKTIANRGSVSSQIAPSAGSVTGSASASSPVTSAINMAAAQTLTVTGTKASGGETLALESVLVELLRGV